MCCLTDADCATLQITPTACADGFVCRDLVCVEATCDAASQCTVDKPVCDVPAGLCESCVTSSDCAPYPNAPYCDPATGGCRACKLDSECASDVCDADAGTCVNSTEVVYVAANGTDTAACTHGQPCSMTRALVVATADPSSTTIRMLPGVYTNPLTISSSTIMLVGADSVFRGSGSTILAITGSADVTIRGLAFDLSQGNVRCDGSATDTPSLTLRDLTVSSNTNKIAAFKCSLQIRDAVFKSNSQAVSFGDDTRVDIDGALFTGNGAGSSGMIGSGSRITLRMSNSVFDPGSFGFSANGTANDGSKMTVAFNTFLLGPNLFTCNSQAVFPAVVENNIFVGSGTDTFPFLTPLCTTLQNNIVFPQTEPLSGTNFLADPQLTDAANPDLAKRDYRPRGGSPAIDAAILSLEANPDHDFVGAPRPQGSGRDIGALEVQP